MSESKNKSLNRKINLKNKKEASKVLNKKIAVAQPKKSSSKKKQPAYNKKKIVRKTKEIEEIVKQESQVVSDKKVKKEKIEKVSKNIKAPVKKEVKKEVKKTPRKKETKIVKKKQEAPKKKISKIKNKLKDKIFEEVTENQVEVHEEKPKSKKNRYILIGVFALLIVGATIFILNNKDFLKKEMNLYPEYLIGEKVELEDKTVWYVIENSSGDKNTVKLLKETQIDINGDGVFDDNDKKRFSSKGSIEYDANDTESAAYYLANNYRKNLESIVGSINSIALLTSKEYVKIRNKMEFGYEWSEGNWLANSSLGTWWINSSQSDKIYAVTNIGSYKLYQPTKYNYVRPVIEVNKDLTTKKD